MVAVATARAKIVRKLLESGANADNLDEQGLVWLLALRFI